MNAHVLLTGAGGFIGSHAIDALLRRGCTVHAVHQSEKRETRNEKHLTWHRCDLLDSDQTAALVEAVQPTHLLHFAWIATPGVYQTAPENEPWKDTSLRLFDLCRAQGCRRIVGAGTCFEYDWTQGHCTEGQTPLHPTTLYGEQKKACGEALLRTNDTAAWGRIFFLYGPREHPNRLVSSVIRSLLRNEQAACTHGNQIRDFLHVADVADAFAALLLSDVSGAVNIASGTPVTIAEVVNTIGGLMRREELIALGARTPPANEPPRITADTKRLREEVGWKPTFTLESGLQQTIEWWRDKQDLHE